MAEFCLDCYNRLSGTSLTEGEVRFSRRFELCEGCGRWRPVIVKLKKTARKGTCFSRKS